MAEINILSSKIFNRIAAGEVIERPASVVKELVENSIDAKATNITVEILDGGISMIKVIDNGLGIEKSELKKAFTKLYPLSEKDTLIDLGAGDGVVLKVASEFKAKGIGIELNPVFALISKFRLRKIKNTKILTKNFYNYEFPEETTAVYIFGDSRDIEKITRKIEREAKRLKKSIYVISNGFRLPSHKPIKHVGAYYLYRIK